MQASLLMLQQEVVARIDETEKLQTLLDEETAHSVVLQTKVSRGSISIDYGTYSSSNPILFLSRF